MALSRRSSNRFQNAIWPGFVDAMTGLLLVLMFVLTIFMVIQFVLREQITGQESELDALGAQIATLTETLGIERNRVQGLSADLDQSIALAQSQAGRIATLIAERDTQSSELAQAQSQITRFEAQVAGLLADRADANQTIAGLEAAQADLLSEQDALNLALSQARNEIDAGAEAARLAAARREALEALVTDLETKNSESAAQISALEADRLVDAAAAEALRERLANADTELTAMTLNLEAQRKEAEDTLTLLAAARSAREQLATELDALQTAQAQVTANLSQEEAERRAAEAERRAAEAAAARAASENADLNDQLADALAALNRAQTNETLQSTQAERQAALLDQANSALAQEQALSAQSQRQVALLNEQVTELRNQVGNLQSLLNLAEETDREAQVQIETLGAQLNTALARVVSEERQRRALEEAERIRLEEEAARLAQEAEILAAEAQDLARFKSDFFGQLREVLEGQDRVRVEGDRFVFSSEVLFEPGQARLSASGEAEIANIADILRSIADDIPPGIDWVIRVDGHTDDIPVGRSSRFADNWELSQARALSVVRYMSQDLGIPPQRLAANGFGEFQPINPADTPEARAQNRRIELKLTER
ncbi:peptidoglycan -binding protein [Yoonia sediminilitoris]|uniref:Chemotaxis protein MotB n=1 Tax=Yoonia sediminilitoris TaxID=1286148 RepID=A0A2T6K9Z2_9RHOB|nr:peptidoglycan -binding protein [Yoonia sediminilitoris]PUB11565.1 chemotaxis protein MotB [Yoonia sediminilitoris]RCW91765.1 chemotaxis protein MotB [Yoonia sediminilitoris]